MQSVLETVVIQFTATYGTLRKQTDGLTHADSLLQLPFRGNCLNWTVGHILFARNNLCKMMGIRPFWTDEETAPYGRDSVPITPENAHIAHRLENLLALHERSQGIIIPAIEHLTEADLQKPFRDNVVGYWLARSAYHEAYHVGQTEILRQLAGKNDQIL